jgi:hypothetical protein
MRYGAAKSLAEDIPTFIDIPYYSSAVFSPNGRYVGASHRDGIIRIWDVRTGRLIRRFKADIDALYGIAFMPHGNGLVSGGWEGILKYWDISSLYTTQASQMASDLYGHVPGIEGHPQPERSFFEHTVRLSISSLSLSCNSLRSFNSMVSIHMPSPLIADGLSLALAIKASESGTLGMQRRNASSMMFMMKYGRSILVQQVVILPLGEREVR